MRNRLLPLVALAAAVVVVGTACSGSLRDAATVGDEHVRRDQLEDELRLLLGNEAFVELLEQNGFPPMESDSTTDSGLTANWLSTLVFQVVIDEEFAARDLEVNDADREAARVSLEARFGGAEVFGEFDDDFQGTLIEREARTQAILRDVSGSETEISEAEIVEFYEANVAQACPSGRDVAHILVETDDEANEILAELEDGADFATLAQERSTDAGSSSNGGSYGCLVEGQFVPEFEQAALGATIGEPVGPVQTEFGSHVILVTEAVPPPLEEARAQIVATLQQQRDQLAQQQASQAMDEALLGRLADADIWIAPRYGTWLDDGEQIGVQPPESPDVRDDRSPTTATTVPPAPQG